MQLPSKYPPSPNTRCFHFTVVQTISRSHPTQTLAMQPLGSLILLLCILGVTTHQPIFHQQKEVKITECIFTTNMADGQAAQYHAWWFGATQAAINMEGYFHAGAPTLWSPTFQDTSVKLPPPMCLLVTFSADYSIIRNKLVSCDDLSIDNDFKHHLPFGTVLQKCCGSWYWQQLSTSGWRTLIHFAGCTQSTRFHYLWWSFTGYQNTMCSTNELITDPHVVTLFQY
jgi:hypothetical protein